jgi:hypothetical protein
LQVCGVILEMAMPRHNHGPLETADCVDHQTALSSCPTLQRVQESEICKGTVLAPPLPSGHCHLIPVMVPESCVVVD